MHTQRLAIGAILSVVIVTGLVHGLWTGRWSAATELTEAVTALDVVPFDVGDWRGKEEELDPEMVRQAGLSGAWMRRYSQENTGASVTVLLMCGPPGTTSVHTPEWCYGGAGYDMIAAPVQFQLPRADTGSAEFWTAKFRKENAAVPSHLRIFWSWRAAQVWHAAEYPRLAFARQPVLYKLYVVREMTSPTEPTEEDPCVDFLRQFLPLLDASLPF